MPHVTIKAYPGKSDEQKARLAEAVTRAVMEIYGSAEASVSVSVEDVARDLWKATVYDPEIMRLDAQLYKRPGYKM